MKNLKKERGITLIALIITVIILVILAAVSIRAVTNMKIVDYAINGAQNYVIAEREEKKQMNEMVSFLKNELLELKRTEAGIELNKNKLTLSLPNETETLIATLSNLEGNITWSSSNTEVATVSQDGVVTALAEGSTTITAKVIQDSKDYIATCDVIVLNDTRLIKFTFNGIECTAEDGMTWEQWINTDYNTVDIVELDSTFIGYSIYNQELEYRDIEEGNQVNNINPSDVIVNLGKYYPYRTYNIGRNGQKTYEPLPYDSALPIYLEQD